MTENTTKRISKKRLLIIGGVIGLPVLLVAVFFYLVFGPRPVDRHLFDYIKQPYAKQDVIYFYSSGEEYGLTFARITPDQAKQTLANNADIFPYCKDKSVNDTCTKAWVPNSTKSAQLTLGMQKGDDEKAARDAYTKTITKDSFCNFSFVDTLCINPTNGYVMYTYLNP